SANSAAADAGDAASAAVAASRVPLVSQALGPDFYSVLHGTGRLPAPVSLDGILGPQFFLRIRAGMAPFLAQLVRARGDQRAGSRQLVYCVPGSSAAAQVPPARPRVERTLKKTLIGVVLVGAMFYVADYVALRSRRQPFGSVQVKLFYEV